MRFIIQDPYPLQPPRPPPFYFILFHHIIHAQYPQILAARSAADRTLAPFHSRYLGRAAPLGSLADLTVCGGSARPNPAHPLADTCLDPFNPAALATPSVSYCVQVMYV